MRKPKRLAALCAAFFMGLCLCSAAVQAEEAPAGSASSAPESSAPAGADLPSGTGTVKEVYTDEEGRKFYTCLLYTSPHGLYLGSTGTGKSFCGKREIINVFLATQDRIIVEDPMGEYAPLVKRLGGQVLTISPDVYKRQYRYTRHL